MNNQCLSFPLLMHLFKGLNITRRRREKKQKKKKKYKKTKKNNEKGWSCHPRSMGVAEPSSGHLQPPLGVAVASPEAGGGHRATPKRIDL
jgi:hypothetical protein